MSVYIVAKIIINDRESYGSYESGFMEIFARHKGQLLSVDEAPHLLEGKWNVTRTVLLRFPDRTDAEAWYYSDEYQELMKHRLAASDGDIVILQGLD